MQAGLLLSATEIIGDYGAKSDNALLTYGGYHALAWELRSLLRNNSLALVNAYWDGISNVATLTLGYLLNERLTSGQWLGAILVSVGIAIMEFSASPNF